MLTAAVVVLAALLGEGGAAAAPAPETLKVHEGPLDKALASAKESGRTVLVDFYADWCGPCKAMDEKVFKDPEVVAYCNQSYVLFRVDVDKNKELSERYGVTGIPCFVLIDAAGTELDRSVGFAAKDAFLPYLKDVKAGNHLKGLRDQVAKAPEDAVLRAKLGVKLVKKQDPEGREHLDKAVALDAKDAHPETIEARYYLSLLEANEQQSPEPIAAFAKKYADSPSAAGAHRILLNVARQMQDEDAEAASLEFLVKRAPEAGFRNDLAWFLATHDRDLERALSLVDAALKEEPKVSAFLDTRAECLARLGRLDEAVETQKKAVAALGPDVKEEQRAEYGRRLEEFQKKRDDAAKK
jgi:thioredoxin-like negative regulator of GroEL